MRGHEIWRTSIAQRISWSIDAKHFRISHWSSRGLNLIRHRNALAPCADAIRAVMSRRFTLRQTYASHIPKPPVSAPRLIGLPAMPLRSRFGEARPEAGAVRSADIRGADQQPTVQTPIQTDNAQQAIFSQERHGTRHSSHPQANCHPGSTGRRASPHTAHPSRHTSPG